MTIKKRILVCVNGPYCCKLNPHPQDLVDALARETKAQKTDDKFEILAAGCLGMCQCGPSVRVLCGGRSNIAYCTVKPEDAAAIIAAHSGDDKPIERLRFNRSR